MRTILPLLVVFVLVAMAAPSSAQTTFSATLNGDQAGQTSSASGTAELTLNVTQDALSYSITIVGLDLDGNQTPMSLGDNITAMHFHAAPPGMNGGVVFGLIAPNHDTDDLVIDPVAGTLSGVWEDTDSNPLSGQLANLEAGGLYLNVHTATVPGGEIRGQVEPVIFSDGFESGNVTVWSDSVP